MECLKSDTTMTVMPSFGRQFCFILMFHQFHHEFLCQHVFFCTDRNPCNFCSPFYSKLCALSVYSTLEGQIKACYEHCPTVAEHGTVVSCRSYFKGKYQLTLLTLIFLKELRVFFSLLYILFCCIYGIRVSFTLL